MTNIWLSDFQGNVPSFTKLILLRYLPLALISPITFPGMVLWLLDVLFIVRKDRRCLHDLVAGSVVVKATQPEEAGSC